MNALQQQLEPGLAHDKIIRTIELYGRRVAPLVRDMLGSA
jgi:hypothetical protein